MKNKSLIACFFAIVLAIGTMCLLGVNDDVVYATGNSVTAETPSGVDYIVEKHTNISDYRTKNADGYYTSPSIQATDVTNATNEWVFAGWYTNSSCTETLKKSKVSGEGYAKFVSADVLSVKCQLSTDTQPTSPSTFLRCISSVDTLKYSFVGFDLEIYYADESKENKNMQGSTVGTRIQVTADKKSNPCNYSPKVVDTESEYFYSAVEEIQNKYFDAGYLIKPYWITKDGTKVYGVSRYVVIDDVLNHSAIYLPVKKSNAPTTGETFTIGETEAVCKVYDADGGYAQLGYEFDSSTLGSVTKFTITGEDKAESTVYYRNLNTKYSGSNADKSWYNAYTETTEDEFVIATNADMYGLSVLADTTNKKTFEGKTIYLCADIDMNNSWTPTVDTTGNVNNLPSNVNVWKPIGVQNGTQFKGVFDGQGHEISGLYVTSTQHYGSGLFGCIGSSNAAIKNVRLVDSYIKTSHNQTGSIVGWAVAGTIQNVYSNAIIVSAPSASSGAVQRLGGLVGLCEAANTQLKMEGSCFEGTIKSSRTYAIGGLIGLVNSDTITITIDTCLFDGIIDSTDIARETYYCGGVVGANLKKGTLNIVNSISAGSVSLTVDALVDNAAPVATGGVCGSVKENTKIETTYALTKVRYKISSAGQWNDITKVVGHADSGAILKTDNSLKDTFQNTPVQLCGQAAVKEFTKLKFTRTASDTTNIIWKWRAGALPIPEGLIDSIPVDISWYDASATEYYIQDASDMYGLTKLVAGGNTFEGKTIFLTADLEMNLMEGNTLQSWIDGTAVPENFWTPIGTKNGTNFKGVFEGQGHEMRGLYVSSHNDQGTGLFGCISGSNTVIKNLRLIDSYIESTNSSYTRIGSIVGWVAGGTIQNVYSNATLYSKAATVGGLIGLAAGNLTINSCWYDGNIITVEKAYEIGGLVGNAYSGTTVIDTCLYTGYLDATYTNGVSANSTLNLHVGGLCGSHNKDATFNVTNSICAGNFDFTFDNTKNVSVNLSRLGTLCGSHTAKTSVTDTYDMIQARHKQIDVSDSWNEITYPGGFAKNASAILDVDASFKGNVTAAYGDAAVAKLTKLRFSRATGDTTSLIWISRTGTLPIPEGLSTFCN